jgi:hypothetical protein
MLTVVQCCTMGILAGLGNIPDIGLFVPLLQPEYEHTCAVG